MELEQNNNAPWYFKILAYVIRKLAQKHSANREIELNLNISFKNKSQNSD